MAHSQEIRLLFFATLRERLGVREMNISLDDDITVRDFMVVLAERIPEFAGFKSSARLAVNRVYAEPDTVIRDGDEVAIITPVSGG